MYDIVNHVSRECGEFSKEDFIELFEAISKNSIEEGSSEKVEKVLSWLPTSLMVMEEHLKVWFIKKLFAETLLLDENLRTRKFFVLGMGMRNGKRMSSSRGTAILLQDLLESYSPIKTRMIILMVGGHPNKFYNYSNSVITQVDSLLTPFVKFIYKEISSCFSSKEAFINQLCDSISRQDMVTELKNYKELMNHFIKLDSYISDGYFNQCLTEIMSLLPKKYKKANADEKVLLLKIIDYYLKILLGIGVTEIWL